MESEPIVKRPEEIKNIDDRPFRPDRSSTNRRVIMSTVSLACRKSYEHCLPLKTPNNLMKNRDLLLDSADININFSNGESIKSESNNDVNNEDLGISNAKTNLKNVICINSLTTNNSNINLSETIDTVDAVCGDIRAPVLIHDNQTTNSVEEDVIIRDISKCEEKLEKNDHCLLNLDAKPLPIKSEKYLLTKSNELLVKDEIKSTQNFDIVQEHMLPPQHGESHEITIYEAGPIDRNSEVYEIEGKSIRDRDKEFNDKGIVIIELDQVKIPSAKGQGSVPNHINQNHLENINEPPTFIRQKSGDFSLTLVENKYARNHAEYQDIRQKPRNNVCISMINTGTKEMTYVRQKSSASLEIPNETYIRLKKQNLANDATYIRQKSLPDVTTHRGAGNSAGVVSSTSNRMRPPPPPPPLAGHTLSHTGHPPVVNHHSEEPTSSIPDLGE